MTEQTKAYVVGCSTEADFDCAQAENEARDMDRVDYASPRVLGVYTTLTKALRAGIHEVQLEFRELYDNDSEDELAGLKEIEASWEWVQLVWDGGEYVEQDIGSSSVVRPPTSEGQRPSYKAALITRNPNNRDEWDVLGCVVIQEVNIDE